MKTGRHVVTVLRGITFAVALSLAPTATLWADPPKASAPPPPSMAAVQAAYGHLPLSFEANQGQTDSHVNYLARGQGYTLFLTPSEAILVLRQPAPHSSASSSPSPLVDAGSEEGTMLRLQLLGATHTSALRGVDELPGKANYFIGNNPEMWRTNVPNFAKVTQPQVYPGIDMVYYGNQQQLEFDFIVAPGADPRLIRLNVEGADRLEIDAKGDLLLHASSGNIQLQRPRVYQEVEGVRREVSGQYVVKDVREVNFQVAAYDISRPLIIDPTLVYSTYLGGNKSDAGYRIALDSLGNAYVTGITYSLNFPTPAGFFQPTFGGGDYDAFVTKLNPAGSALVYSTFLGGSSGDAGGGIAVDGSGNAFVMGTTYSTNFPITPGAFQPTFGGAAGDAFATKLNPAGSALVYSTFLGGSNSEEGFGIAVDGSGNAYVTGHTSSTNFPTTPGAFQITAGSGDGNSDAFATALNPTGATLVYSTYLGGSSYDDGRSIAVDGSSNAYVTGFTSSVNFPITAGAFQPTSGGGPNDAFVTALASDGAALYSTYLGGNSGEAGYGIAVDASGNAYVTGYTQSSNFPTTTGAFQFTFGGDADAFVTTLNPTGAALVYSTFLGGSSEDQGGGIAVDGSGNAYVTGQTRSSNFPITPGAVQTSSGGNNDVFVTTLDPTGAALGYSTYLGGSNFDQGSSIAVDGSGNVYVTGYTDSTNFPTSSGAFDITFGGGSLDAFVAKINTVVAPPGANVFLHGSPSNNNPPTLFLNAVAPTATTPKYRDSSSVNFSGGNLWKDIGTWTTALPSPFNGNLTALGPLNVWVGLKNSDDQGTQFDVRAEVYKNASLLVAGETRCITDVTRNENLAKAVAVTFPTFSPVSFNGTIDVLSVKVSTRIGTNPDSTKCSGPGGSHNNAVGLRLYFDATDRAAEFVGTFAP